MLIWADEEHVRVYTRDSEEWIALSWEARALWHELVRKLDRTGRLPMRLGRRALAALIRFPPDVIDRGMDELVADGHVVESEAGYFAPSHEAAQAAAKSEKFRAQRARDRRQSVVTKCDAGGAVTSGSTPDRSRNRDEAPQESESHEDRSSLRNVTKDDVEPVEIVMSRDAEIETSYPTTGIARLRSLSGSSYSSLPELPDPDPRKILGAESDARATPRVTTGLRIVPVPDRRIKLHHDVWQYASRRHAELKATGISPNAPKFPAMPCGDPAKNLAERAAELLRRDETPDYDAALADMKRRVNVAAAEATREPRSLQYFTPMLMWRSETFWRAMDMSPEEASQPRFNARASPRDGSPDQPTRQIKTLS